MTAPSPQPERKMRTTLRAENPGDIVFTLSVTMPLSQWLTLQKQLKTDWPSMDLWSAINGMVSRAKAEYGYDTSRQRAGEEDRQHDR